MVELDIKDHPQGAVLPIRVQPGAKKTGVLGEQAGALKIAVAAAPEQGKANKAVLDVLVEFLEVKKNLISLISGQTNRNKKYLILNWSAESLRNHILKKLGSPEN